ncbi:MAG: TIGR03792 family protein [Leptolyngbyaceae cyanobacterium RU_5_1]|nr:TIGR03792 family protein [Leptolyngbyaceae cyanobacterium RU_5_1]
MVIEWLKIEVSRELQEKFIQTDEAIWTATLAKYPGFLGKHVWINPKEPNEVVLVIHWASLENWKSIPADVLEETERQFSAQMGKGTYRLVEVKEYQVRKFAQPKP